MIETKTVQIMSEKDKERFFQILDQHIKEPVNKFTLEYMFSIIKNSPCRRYWLSALACEIVKYRKAGGCGEENEEERITDFLKKHNRDIPIGELYGGQEETSYS